ncbi:response regulator transcription factor [Vagococcus salmoninarum]|uniref:response regulator transcription factor n=1 Tax=Vagococcus salmoninarum TaxID=2739 RepID=UPI003F9C19E4
MKKILLVEDDLEISEMLTLVLGLEYQIVPAYSGTEGLLQFASQRFDLVLLDIMLPGKTGLEVLLELRQTSQVPIIILTALQDKKMVTDYLLQGADDYMNKPFDNDELKARIVVQLRRSADKSEPLVINQYKNVFLNGNLFQLTLGEEQIQLAKKEYLIFQLLVQNPNKIYTKGDLYEKVWGEAYYGDENTINVHISNLRKKLQKIDPETNYIETVWSIGVKLAD